MSTAQARTTRTATPRLGRIVAGVALALTMAAAATPALAGNDHRDHREWRGGYYGPPGHAKHHHHGHAYYGYRAPVYVYAPPPPVYYGPPPIYYPPPQPGLTIVFPIDLN